MIECSDASDSREGIPSKNRKTRKNQVDEFIFWRSRILGVHECYLNIFIRNDISVVITAMAKIGSHHSIDTVGTNWSATYTMMADITKENSQRVISLRGNEMIRRRVQRTRFTSARTMAKIRALTYPFCKVMPEICPEFAIKNIAPALIKNDTI